MTYQISNNSLIKISQTTTLTGHPPQINDDKEYLLPKSLASQISMNPITLAELNKSSSNNYEKTIRTLINKLYSLKKSNETLNTETNNTCSQLSKIIARALQLCHSPDITTRKQACEVICRIHEGSSQEIQDFIAASVVRSYDQIKKGDLLSPSNEVHSGVFKYRPSKQVCAIALFYLYKVSNEFGIKGNKKEEHIEKCKKIIEVQLKDNNIEELDGDRERSERIMKACERLSNQELRERVQKQLAKVKIEYQRNPQQLIERINSQVEKNKIVVNNNNKMQDESTQNDNQLKTNTNVKNQLERIESKDNKLDLVSGTTNIIDQPKKTDKLNKLTTEKKHERRDPGDFRMIIAREVTNWIHSLDKDFDKLVFSDITMQGRKKEIDNNKYIICNGEDYYDKLKGLPYDVVYMDYRNLGGSIEKFEIHRISCGIINRNDIRQPIGMLYKMIEVFVKQNDKDGSYDDYEPKVFSAPIKCLNGGDIIVVAGDNAPETYFYDGDTGEVVCVWAQQVEVDQRNNPVTDNAVTRGIKKLLNLYS